MAGGLMIETNYKELEFFYHAVILLIRLKVMVFLKATPLYL